jgi:hypothetical protein
MEQELSLVVPATGEILSLDDMAGCLRVLTEIRDLESRLREAKAALTDALSYEFSRQGTKTIEIDGVKAELRGGTEVIWDVEVLDELRALGLPEERMGALITTEVTYRVNANVAKQIAAANPLYADVIEKARNTIPKATYVAVRKA